MGVKGLRKMLYPFAPDQSGAAAVLYELGGMIIICDAGGCAGNVCGFDEPRWFRTRSAVFSAGLRDMDAILGRDDLLVRKIGEAAEKLHPKFVAVIGTPVPATIATDYRAIRRMTEKRTGLPVITIDSNGILWYDEGATKAYMELFRCFAEDCVPEDVIPGSVGILGATPLDFEQTDAGLRMRDNLKAEGASEVLCYGMDGDLDSIRRAGRMERNLVVSPAGIRAARELETRFGTPYTCGDPLIRDIWADLCAKQPGLPELLRNERILVLHQQVRANALRDVIEAETDAEVTAATWFRLVRSIARPGDFKIREEQDYFDLVASGKYDVIFADPSFRKASRNFDGLFVDLPHFAVSGQMEHDEVAPFYS
ncbi:MAG: nitrogenase molybdenum-iron protein [Mogibacterium sp.]|nr:nitrogenase molybdenum-iron protein [Mogibacterium sp.]